MNNFDNITLTKDRAQALFTTATEAAYNLEEGITEGALEAFNSIADSIYLAALESGLTLKTRRTQP